MGGGAEAVQDLSHAHSNVDPFELSVGNLLPFGVGLHRAAIVGHFVVVDFFFDRDRVVQFCRNRWIKLVQSG